MRSEKRSIIRNDIQFSESFELFFYFQQVPFHFKSNSKRLIDELRNYLPAHWIFNSLKNAISVEFASVTSTHISLDAFESDPSQDCFYFDDNSIIVQRDFVAKKVSKRHYRLICEDKVSDGLFNFFRWLMPSQLLEMNQYLLHSGCVVQNNYAHLFLGHSGKGKTTVTKILKDEGAKLLSDDMNILIFEKEQFKVKGAGLGGLYSPKTIDPSSFSIKNIYWLHQASKNELISMSKGEAFQYIICSLNNLVNNERSKSEQDKIFKISKKISYDFNFYHLHFNLKDSLSPLLGID